MIANPTPVNDTILLARCGELLHGLQTLERELAVSINNSTVLSGAIDLAATARSKVASLKTERSKCRDALRAADVAGKKRISCCRLRLVPALGSTFNANWWAAGFPDHSTQVPESLDKRLTLLRQLELYFALKPEHESVDMGATAATCLIDQEALTAVRSAASEVNERLQTAVTAKNTAFAGLRGCMRALIQELKQRMSSDDSRWEAFGLNIPSRGNTPEPVQAIALTALGQGQILVQWPRAARARRYRVQVRLPGSLEFTHALSVRTKQALLKKLPAGQLVEIRVIAANPAGEAAPSPAVSIEVRVI